MSIKEFVPQRKMELASSFYGALKAVYYFDFIVEGVSNGMDGAAKYFFLRTIVAPNNQLSGC